MKRFHWGYVVPEIHEAVALWEEWGGKLIVPPQRDDELNVDIAVVDFYDAPVELLADSSGKSEYVKAQLQNGGGLDHYCVFADQLEAELKSMESKGGQIALPPAYNYCFDREVAFIITPMGLVLELVSLQATGKRDPDPLAYYFEFYH